MSITTVGEEIVKNVYVELDDHSKLTFVELDDQGTGVQSYETIILEDENGDRHEVWGLLYSEGTLKQLADHLRAVAKFIDVIDAHSIKEQQEAERDH